MTEINEPAEGIFTYSQQLFLICKSTQMFEIDEANPVNRLPSPVGPPSPSPFRQTAEVRAFTAFSFYVTGMWFMIYVAVSS